MKTAPSRCCSRCRELAATTRSQAAPTPPTETKKAAPAADNKQLEAVQKNTQVSPNLALSGDIMQMCGIKAASTAAPPQFDYDKDELTPEDRTVLDQLATCLTNGALKGKAVSLIGRADPRGTEEYNLGPRLAALRLGEHVPRAPRRRQTQLAVTTRGALDATGTDESGWAKDRRVDVLLKVD